MFTGLSFENASCWSSSETDCCSSSKAPMDSSLRSVASVPTQQARCSTSCEGKKTNKPLSILFLRVGLYGTPVAYIGQHFIRTDMPFWSSRECLLRMYMEVDKMAGFSAVTPILWNFSPEEDRSCCVSFLETKLLYFSMIMVSVNDWLHDSTN